MNHNLGNQRYLQMVIDRKTEYMALHKASKATVAWDIMTELKSQCPPARFLKKDHATGLWHPVPDKQVRRKISQALRERGTPVLPTGKKSSKQAIQNEKRARSSELSEQALSGKFGKASQISAESLGSSTDAHSSKRKPEAHGQSFQSNRDESPIDLSSEGGAFEVPKIPPPRKLGDSRDGSGHTLSDFFGLNGPLASITFSTTIFDSSVALESSWENVLDPGCAARDEATIESVPEMPKPTTTSHRMLSMETVPTSDLQHVTSERKEEELSLVDSFFSSNITNIGKTLEKSCLMRASAPDSE